MGGGNGAGAVPLSQIYEQISGEPAANYYSFAIIILTIANLFCILAGALLNRLGKKVPSLTGDGTNIMPVDSKLIKEDVEIKVSLTDYSGTLLLMGAVYAVGRLFSKVLLPTVFGAQIHTFAYSIIFVVVLAALGIVPANIRVAARNMQSFMVSVVALMTMVGLGFDFDLGELVSACSPANLIIAAVIVVGAILGSGLVGKLVGFYPIDAQLLPDFAWQTAAAQATCRTWRSTETGTHQLRTAFQPCGRWYCADHCIVLLLVLLIIKYFAEKEGLKREDICSVSVMPCTAKKFECKRPEMKDDVDIVITVTELAKMIRTAGIDFDNLEERLEFTAVRGFEGIREASLQIGDLTVKVAIVHGLANAKKVLELVREGKADYHYISRRDLIR